MLFNTRNLFIFLITFFYFLPAVAETALQCQMYKQCTTIGDKGCTTDVDHNEDILVVINDEIQLIMPYQIDIN